MSNVGEVVAAVSGGGISSIAAMLVLEVRWLREQLDHAGKPNGRARDAPNSRIDSAVESILGQVEEQRRTAAEEREAGRVVEVRSKAHLRMLVERPRSGCAFGDEQLESRVRKSGPVTWR